MAEPTEQDQAKARELVAARVKAVWSNAFSLGTVKEQADEVDRIARALAAAREQGYMSGFAACYREQKDSATRAAAESARPTP